MAGEVMTLPVGTGKSDAEAVWVRRGKETS